MNYVMTKNYYEENKILYNDIDNIIILSNSNFEIMNQINKLNLNVSNKQDSIVLYEEFNKRIVLDLITHNLIDYEIKKLAIEIYGTFCLNILYKNPQLINKVANYNVILNCIDNEDSLNCIRKFNQVLDINKCYKLAQESCVPFVTYVLYYGLCILLKDLKRILDKRKIPLNIKLLTNNSKYLVLFNKPALAKDFTTYEKKLFYDLKEEYKKHKISLKFYTSNKKNVSNELFKYNDTISIANESIENIVNILN